MHKTENPGKKMGAKIFFQPRTARRGRTPIAANRPFYVAQVSKPAVSRCIAGFQTLTPNGPSSVLKPPHAADLEIGDTPG